MNAPLLEVKNLTTEFVLSKGVVHAVNDVSYSIKQGEVLGIVGESGCGKSVNALSLMRLIKHPGRIAGGQVLLREKESEKDLLSLSEQEIRKIRGNKISMIFQDPMTSLNPVLTVGFQIMEPLKIHRGMNQKDAKDFARQLLEKVGIPEAGLRLKDYPHQFSGGMRQRVMIAIAVACNPKLLIADEPTTALDVTIQAQILDLIKELNKTSNTAVMMITHDLGVVAEMATNVAVMYAGYVIENGPVDIMYESPKHPYTLALMSSIPSLHFLPKRLATIEGAPPTLLGILSSGCPFSPRCGHCIPMCYEERPTLAEISPNHYVACWVAQQGGI